LTKVINLNEDVYSQLNDLRLPHETFSGAVLRLLLMHKQMREMLKALAGEPRAGEERVPK